MNLKQYQGQWNGKWKNFINLRIDNTFDLETQRYYTGESLGDTIDDTSEFNILTGEELSLSNILEDKKMRASYVLKDSFLGPDNEEDYDALLKLFFEKFGHNDFKYVQFLILVIEFIESQYRETHSNTQINELILSCIIYIQENELKDKDFVKLPMDWKLEIAKSTIGGEKE